MRIVRIFVLMLVLAATLSNTAVARDVSISDTKIKELNDKIEIFSKEEKRISEGIFLGNKINTKEEAKNKSILKRWKTKQTRKWEELQYGKNFTISASAYTAAADECGWNTGITASGLIVEEKRTLACPPEYPFGTKISIEGYGTFRCEDRGGAIKGNHFDIYMETKTEAFQFGRRSLIAQVVK